MPTPASAAPPAPAPARLVQRLREPAFCDFLARCMGRPDWRGAAQMEVVLADLLAHPLPAAQLYFIHAHQEVFAHCPSLVDLDPRWFTSTGGRGTGLRSAYEMGLQVHPRPGQSGNWVYDHRQAPLPEGSLPPLRAALDKALEAGLDLALLCPGQLPSRDVYTSPAQILEDAPPQALAFLARARQAVLQARLPAPAKRPSSPPTRL